jgi:riboflavin biosynthesis pyrimidine reductase
MPLPRSHTHVFSNFVTTLDGVVSFNTKGHASGGDISGFSAQDRMVMGLLRAVADVVIIGSGTLGVDCRHVWTAEAIFPALVDDYRQLRKTLAGENGIENEVNRAAILEVNPVTVIILQILTARLKTRLITTAAATANSGRRLTTVKKEAKTMATDHSIATFANWSAAPGVPA